jgi:hypothetical protein
VEFKRAVALFFIILPLSLEGEGDTGGEVIKSTPFLPDCQSQKVWPDYYTQNNLPPYQIGETDSE